MLANLSTGYMLAHSGGSYAGPLRLTVTLYAVALLPFLVFCSGRPLFR
eukprot:SAG22_NODE_2049_length_3084_cov_3.086767_2_plen_48_part_00